MLTVIVRFRPVVRRKSTVTCRHNYL